MLLIVATMSTTPGDCFYTTTSLVAILDIALDYLFQQCTYLYSSVLLLPNRVSRRQNVGIGCLCSLTPIGTILSAVPHQPRQVAVTKLTPFLY